jgi:TonB family protein
MVNTANDITIKTKASAWTVGVHVLLLLLFIFWKYSLPETNVVEDAGMEVNLGTDDNGSGDDQPMSINAPAPDKTNNKYQSAAKQNEGMKDMQRSDEPDAPAIGPVSSTNNTRRNADIQNDHRNRNTQQQVSDNNNRQQQQPRYTYHGATGQGGNSAASNAPGTNEGNTTGPGDRGVPGGTPGAANYTGNPGNGNGGMSHTLGGRDISPARFEASFREGGKVLVQVTVDRDGNIISKRIKSSPNAELSRIAMQKLAEARFSKSANAAPEQIGIVTIVFKARS